MPRKPDFDTLDQVIHYHIGLWYGAIERDPKIGETLEGKYAEAVILDKSYRDYLERFHPEWVTPDSLEQFQINLDYLTYVFTRTKQKQEAHEKQEKLMEHTMQKMAERQQLSQAIKNEHNL